jgi:DNA-binding transcriptional LysR family regulator
VSLGQLDLHLLVALDALLRERQVSRAANRAGISAPSMSRALQRLRIVFDDQLLARAGRGYQPTPVAESLIGPVREILRLVEQLGTDREFRPDTDRRTFRIAAPDSTGLLLAQQLTERMLRDAPGISLAIEPLIGRQTVDHLETGALDLAVWSLGSPDRRLCQEPLYDDLPVAAVWSPRTDVGDRLTPEQFELLPRAHYYSRGHHRLGEEFPDWLASEDPPVRISTRAHLLRLHLVRGTDLIAMTYDTMIRQLGDVLELRAVDLPFPTEPLQRGMVWHPRSTNDPSHRWLRDQLTEIASEL